MSFEEQKLIDQFKFTYYHSAQKHLYAQTPPEDFEIQEILDAAVDFYHEYGTFSVIEHCQQFNYDFEHITESEVALFTYDDLTFLLQYSFAASQEYFRLENEDKNFDDSKDSIPRIIPELLYIFAALLNLDSELSPYCIDEDEFEVHLKTREPDYIPGDKYRPSEVKYIVHIALLANPIISIQRNVADEMDSLFEDLRNKNFSDDKSNAILNKAIELFHQELFRLEIPENLFKFFLPIFDEIRDDAWGDWLTLLPLRMTEFGWLFQRGCKEKNITRDYKKAVQYFEAGASSYDDYTYYERHSMQPYFRACQNYYDLGKCYEFGIGVPQDLIKADEYYHKISSIISLDVSDCYPANRLLISDLHDAFPCKKSSEVRFIMLDPKSRYFLDNRIYPKLKEKSDALSTVKNNGRALWRCSDELKNDDEIVQEALNNDAKALKYASDRFRNDAQTVITAIKNYDDDSLVEFASDELRADYKFIIDVLSLKCSGRAFLNASEELRHDHDFTLHAAQIDGRIMEFAPNEFRGNRDFVLEVVRAEYFDGYALYGISEELKNDYEIFLEGVKRVAWTIQFADYELQSNLDLAIAAVETDGASLYYLTSDMQANRDVVLAAVRNNSLALWYASEELKSDRELVLEAIQNDPYAFRWASKEIQADYEVVLEAVTKCGTLLEYVSTNLQNNREIVLAAIENDPLSYKYSSAELKANRDIVLHVISKDVWLLKYADETILNDSEIILDAMKKDGWILQLVPEELKCDKKFILEVAKIQNWHIEDETKDLSKDVYFILNTMKQDPWALCLASQDLLQNRDFAFEVVKYSDCALKFVEIFQNDYDVVLEAVNHFGSSLQYASEDLKNNFDIVLAAVKNEPYAFLFASDEMRDNEEILSAAEEAEKKKQSQ